MPGGTKRRGGGDHCNMAYPRQAELCAAEIQYLAAERSGGHRCGRVPFVPSVSLGSAEFPASIVVCTASRGSTAAEFIVSTIVRSRRQPLAATAVAWSLFQQRSAHNLVESYVSTFTAVSRLHPLLFSE